MRNIRKIILLVIWIIPIFTLLLLFLTKSNVQDLKDNVYVVNNDIIELELEAEEGNLRPIRIFNRKTKEKLFLSGEEFSLRAGLKSNLELRYQS